MSTLPHRYQHLGEARGAANDNDLAELRRSLAAHNAQRALVARAQAIETELRAHDEELRVNPAPWAVQERARILELLAELDAIVVDGWYVLSTEQFDRLVEWVDK